MPSQAFEKYADRYEQWFERNRVAYETELGAVACLLPAHGLGVEIGTGTGRFAAPLNIRYGVEPSPAMGAIARRRGREVVQAVAESLPFAVETFDFALLVTTLCFLDDAPVALQEAYRVLKAGGSLIVAFIDRESPGGQPYESRKAESVFYRQAHFYSAREVARLIESTGFRDRSCVQTLFQDADRLGTRDPIRAGHGEGTFVVIQGTKPTAGGDYVPARASALDMLSFT